MNGAMNTVTVIVLAGLIAWVPVSIGIIRIITRPRTSQSYRDHVADATSLFVSGRTHQPHAERTRLSADERNAFQRITAGYWTGE